MLSCQSHIGDQHQSSGAFQTIAKRRLYSMQIIELSIYELIPFCLWVERDLKTNRAVNVVYHTKLTIEGG